MIKGKHNREKPCEQMLDGLTKWWDVGRESDLLDVMRDQDKWKANTRENGT